jgi:Uma2 family endonuclease
MATIDLEIEPAQLSAGRTLSISDTVRDAIAIPLEVFSLDGFRSWVMSDTFPEHARAAFVEPELFIDMSPENFETHNAVKAQLHGVLGPLVRALNLGRLIVDDMLVVNRTAGLATEPDASFVSWAAIQSGQARFEANVYGTPMMELHGTPDWVAEIVSPTSVRKDKVRLREAYHKAGIAEFWLIDVRGPDVEFSILRHTANGYSAVLAHKDWLTSDLFGQRFRLERFRDQAGLWDYTLHVQPV